MEINILILKYLMTAFKLKIQICLTFANSAFYLRSLIKQNKTILCVHIAVNNVKLLKN